jgi:hypothetical protein
VKRVPDQIAVEALAAGRQDGHVVIAGFGRVGRIAARTLAARRIVGRLQVRARAQSRELEDLLTQTRPSRRNRLPSARHRGARAGLSEGPTNPASSVPPE